MYLQLVLTFFRHIFDTKSLLDKFIYVAPLFAFNKPFLSNFYHRI